MYGSYTYAATMPARVPLHRRALPPISPSVGLNPSQAVERGHPTALLMGQQRDATILPRDEVFESKVPTHLSAKANFVRILAMPATPCTQKHTNRQLKTAIITLPGSVSEYPPFDCTKPSKRKHGSFRKTLFSRVRYAVYIRRYYTKSILEH